MRTNRIEFVGTQNPDFCLFLEKIVKFIEKEKNCLSDELKSKFKTGFEFDMSITSSIFISYLLTDMTTYGVDKKDWRKVFSSIIFGMEEKISKSIDLV